MRESAEVKKDEAGTLWRNVANGVVNSVDLSPNMKVKPKQQPLPFQMQAKPFDPLPPPTRPPLAPRNGANVNEKVLAGEIKALESKLVWQAKHLELQGRVLKGLCELHVHAQHSENR